MKVRIHRGAHEIGGSCVEVMSDSGQTVILDLGMPLDSDDPTTVSHPSIGSRATGDPPLGVIITHAHQDHWGLVDEVAPEIPIFMGEATHRILTEAAFWTRGLTTTPNRFLVHRQEFALGDFKVTPYLNDHSAFDAYSLLVEADGRRLLYTGDFRGHGRKRGLFEQLLRDPPADVDVLLMEGTNVRPAEEVMHDEGALTETEVEAACVGTIKSTAGMVLALYSAQNIDRMVTLFRAAKRSGRSFVMTLYGAAIARATGNPNIPKPGPEWPHVKVYVPGWQRARVKEAGAFELIDDIKPFRLFEEDLAKAPERWVLSFSWPMAGVLDRASALEGASAIWSMWPGYLEEPSGSRLKVFLAERSIPMSINHTSGHASISDLQRLVKAVAPARVVPIHTFDPGGFDALFEGVEHRGDGEWWDVD